ncbi:MAG: acyl-CoA thioesterase, partial [Candidatus Sumerlaeia bacterium]|nr:acyl-CoA thioesterase [Candidatus Sumerlaeia bacterium]
MDNNKHRQPIISDKTYIRVLYKDTDQMGFVYYANYLVWFELGRAELMRKIGLPYRQVEAQGIYLPVSRCICNYKAPAHYDDLLRIETSILELTEISITFSYKIFREETGELLTTGET